MMIRGHAPTTSRAIRRAVAAALFMSAAMGASIVSAQPVAQPGGGGGAPTKVGTVTVASESVPYRVTLPGRAVAYQQASIRPRVEGVVAEILYEAGRPVEAGSALFRLEGDSYAATLASVEAEATRARAAVRSARTTVERYRSLAGSGFTDEEVEAAEVARLQAEAELSAADAAVEIARLDLDHTEIRSPITGVTDVPSVTIGAIVTANQSDALTTVTRLDPIYVDVAESSARLLRVRERIDSGSLARGDRLGVTLTLENGVSHDGTGELETPGTLVSTSTGTLTFRLRFDNPRRLILPGQFLRVELTLGTTEAVLVPQRATARDSDGTLTAFVARGGVAEQVSLGEAGSHENAWIVTDGISPGERLIVDGLKNLRDGAAITPMPVAIDADGVVTERAANAVE